MLSWLVNPFAERTTWLYDALGRVTTMTHGNLSVAEHNYDAGGTTQVAYTLEPGGGVYPERSEWGNLISQRRAGATAWHLYDALGSTERLTDADQAALATYLNTAFGVPRVATGDHPNRLRWIGRMGYWTIEQGGLHHVRARCYDSSSGRFISEDPARDESHWYRYVRNNPCNGADPAGLWHLVKVHRNMTIKWANDTKAWRGGDFFVRPTGIEAQTMGEASMTIDIIYPPIPTGQKGAWEINLGWHFDFPKGSGSRKRHIDEQFNRAVWYGSEPHCLLSAACLGYALHPLQDIQSHMDVTPLEHIDEANNKFIDDPDRIRGYLWERRDARLGGVYRVLTENQMKWLNDGTLLVRVWLWNEEPYRIERTESNTQAMIEKWLMHTCCGERVPRH